LAKTYACLTEQNKRKKDKAYREFIKLYGIRSRIIHGQYRGLGEPDRNLIRLSAFSSLLRKLWVSILSSKVHCREFEYGDVRRKRYFMKIEGKYNPPKVRIKIT